MTTTQTINGVNTTQLVETVDAIRNDPTLATFRFRARNTWLDCGHSRSTIDSFWGAGREDTSRSQRFTLDGDEPPVLLGSNQAPNAVEAVLHALASCLAVGVSYNAAARGIELRRFEMNLEGTLDLHGFLGLSRDVRPGYQSIQVRYRIDCDAPKEQVDDLMQHVQATSPVLDILQNPVEVTLLPG